MSEHVKENESFNDDDLVLRGDKGAMVLVGRFVVSELKKVYGDYQTRALINATSNFYKKTAPDGIFWKIPEDSEWYNQTLATARAIKLKLKLDQFDDNAFSTYLIAMAHPPFRLEKLQKSRKRMLDGLFDEESNNMSSNSIPSNGILLDDNENAIIENRNQIKFNQKIVGDVIWEPGTQLLVQKRLINNHSDIFITNVKEGGFPVNEKRLYEDYNIVEKISDDKFKELKKTMPIGFDGGYTKSGHKFSKTKLEFDEDVAYMGLGNKVKVTYKTDQNIGMHGKISKVTNGKSVEVTFINGQVSKYNVNSLVDLSLKAFNGDDLNYDDTLEELLWDNEYAIAGKYISNFYTVPRFLKVAESMGMTRNPAQMDDLMTEAAMLNGGINTEWFIESRIYRKLRNKTE